MSLISQGIVGGFAGVTLLFGFRYLIAGLKGQPEFLVIAAVIGVVGVAITGLAYFFLCRTSRLEQYSNGVQIKRGEQSVFIPYDDIAEFNAKEYDLHLNFVYNNTLYWFKLVDTHGQVHRYDCHAMYGSEKQKSIQQFCEVVNKATYSESDS